MKTILYNHWNYLSDKIGISSPDGGFSYLWSILLELQKRGWKTYCGPINRDKESVKKYGKEAFSAFSQEKRWKMYNNLEFVDLNDLPEVDILLLEWRFPTKDNSLKPEAPGYSPDLKIQERLISHYQNTKTKIIIFDLDYKFTKEDEDRIKPWKVIETALNPREGHIGVFIPFDFDEILQFPMFMPKSDKHLVYCGNRYNREIDFNEKLIPYSNKYPGTCHLVGNWMKDKHKEFREKNHNIVYHDRIGAQQFKENLQDALAVPLLATEEYKKTGFMTMRILETLLFGSIPIGFSDFFGIEKFLPKKLIVDMNNYEKSMEKVMNYLKYLGFTERIQLRRNLVKRLKFMDVRFFVDKILEGLYV